MAMHALLDLFLDDVLVPSVHLFHTEYGTVQVKVADSVAVKQLYSALVEVADIIQRSDHHVDWRSRYQAVIRPFTYPPIYVGRHEYSAYIPKQMFVRIPDAVTPASIEIGSQAIYPSKDWIGVKLARPGALLEVVEVDDHMVRVEYTCPLSLGTASSMPTGAKFWVDRDEFASMTEHFVEWRNTQLYKMAEVISILRLNYSGPKLTSGKGNWVSLVNLSDVSNVNSTGLFGDTYQFFADDEKNPTGVLVPLGYCNDKVLFRYETELSGGGTRAPNGVLFFASAHTLD